MRKTVLGLILVLLFVFCYSPAIAKDNYVAVKAGKYLPTGDLNDEDFDDAFMGEVAIGHNFTPNFGLEFGVGHFETKASYSGYDVVIGNWSETNKVSVIPATLTARGIIPIEKASFYVGLGAGIYFVKAEAGFTSDVIALSFDDDDRVLGVHALIGVEYNFTPETFIGIEAKHTWTEDAEFSGSVYGVPIEVETNLDGYN